MIGKGKPGAASITWRKSRRGVRIPRQSSERNISEQGVTTRRKQRLHESKPTGNGGWSELTSESVELISSVVGPVDCVTELEIRSMEIEDCMFSPC